MTQRPNFCGLILAAGFSSRMGSDKALLPWPPKSPSSQTLLAAAIAALEPFTQSILIVAGRNAGALAPIAASAGAKLALNPDPGRGQFSSLRIGLQDVLKRGFEAVIITPVDCPPLSNATLQLLSASYAPAIAAGYWAIAPENDGKHGHPLFAARPLIDAFLQAPSSSNARQVRYAHPNAIQYIPVSDPLVRADMNTPDQYAALAAQIEKGEKPT